MTFLDLTAWPRRNTFEFFKTYESPHFNICAHPSITRTFHYLEKRKISKYNAVLWMISCAANSVPEIRYRIRNDAIVVHDRVDPAFTLLTHDKTLAFCTAEYTSDVSAFFDRVNQGIEHTRSKPKVADTPGMDNVLFVSCVPWINFTSISHPMKKDETDCIPRISWGKFTHDGNSVTMPVSLQLHHALADGYHAGLFFEQLESLLDRPEKIDWPE